MFIEDIHYNLVRKILFFTFIVDEQSYKFQVIFSYDVINGDQCKALLGFSRFCRDSFRHRLFVLKSPKRVQFIR